MEVIGPAGSGKSTIAAILAEVLGCRYLRSFRRDAGLAACTRGAIDVAREAPRVAPLRGGARVVRLMIRPIVPRSTLGTHDARIVFDQGPAYGLVRLTELAAQRSTRRLTRWTSVEATRWRGALDLIVVLDAPNAVLGTRIAERGTPHRFMRHPPDRRERAQDRERETVDRAVELLAPRATIRLDTATTPIGRSVAVVVEAVRGLSGTVGPPQPLQPIGSRSGRDRS